MTDRTRVRRLPEKQSRDTADLHAIIDATLIAHVAITDHEQPIAVPMACARDGDRLLLHGSTGSRLMRRMADGAPICATITILDGLVLARSAYNSSMNYRSAMIFGNARSVQDPIEALRILTEHLLPERWNELRPPSRKEMAATMILVLPLNEWSVKISSGPPDDPEDDLDQPIWAGVVPLHMTAGDPIPSPDLTDDLPPAAAVQAITAALRAAEPPR